MNSVHWQVFSQGKRVLFPICILILIFLKHKCICSLDSLFFLDSAMHLIYLFIFLWSIISLQCCVSFCSITSRISHMYAYILSLLSPPPNLLFYTSRSSQHRAELPLLCSSFLLAVWFIHGSVDMSVLLSQFPHPTPSPAVSSSPFSMSVPPFLP